MGQRRPFSPAALHGQGATGQRTPGLRPGHGNGHVEHIYLCKIGSDKWPIARYHLKFQHRWGSNIQKLRGMLDENEVDREILR